MRCGLSLTSIAVMICIGCDTGPSRVALQGAVTLNGQPVPRGTIQFAPAEGTAGQATGGVITNGRYAVDTEGGALAGGTYVIRIIALRKTGKTLPNRMDPGGPPVELEENYIPAIYNSQSTLKVTISDTDSENTFNFHLKP